MSERAHVTARTGERGFSLIEVIVMIAIISILAGAFAPLALQQVNSRRTQTTRRTMDRLFHAMVGDPELGTFGYVGDMGRLPPTLLDLNSAAGKPAMSIDATGIGQGYGGPYAPELQLGSGGQFVDGWDVPLRFIGNAQVRSAGLDRTFGTADDLVVPPNPVATTGNVVVNVFGVPNTGDPAQQLAATEADVFIARANNGSFAETALAEPVGGPGPFTTTNVHIGHHGLRVVGGGTYAGAATVRSVTTLRGGTIAANVTLVQP